MGKTKTIDRAGVEGPPMVPGTKPEPQGPEDALGKGPTRGDYRDRLGDTAAHFEGGEHQNPRTEEIGDTKGKKGGVETADE
jgi:hypothetical protein